MLPKVCSPKYLYVSTEKKKCVDNSPQCYHAVQNRVTANDARFYAGHFEAERGQFEETRQGVVAVNSWQFVSVELITMLISFGVVMALVLLSPLISAAFWGIRIGIPPVVLLALIFLQQGYKKNLASLPYVACIDMAYTVSYIITLLLFALFLWTAYVFDRAPVNETAVTVQHIDRITFRFQVPLIATFLLLITFGWFVIGVPTADSATTRREIDENNPSAAHHAALAHPVEQIRDEGTNLGCR